MFYLDSEIHFDICCSRSQRPHTTEAQRLPCCALDAPSRQWSSPIVCRLVVGLGNRFDESKGMDYDG